MDNNKFDIIIIGSGYRALVTAYLALKKKKKILIISKSKNLLGIMSPITWQGGKFDKGYQFFDGIDIKQKDILMDFVGSDVLHDFGFGAASLTNNKIYPFHAIPYWPHKSKIFSFKLFAKFIINYKKNIKQIIDQANSYEDLLNLLPTELKNILEKECERRIGLKSKELSYKFQDFPFFNFRQTIMPDNLAILLKKNFDYFDNVIASRRKSLGLECISLYPKGKNMGVAGEIMQKKILDKGVKIKSSISTKISNYNTKEIKIITEDQIFYSDKVYLVTELDDALDFFEKKISSKPNIYYLPQIFFYFTTNKINSKFQYVHGNTEGNLINRANNMSLYGEKTSNNEFVLSAEVADNKNDDLWKDPDKYLSKVWKEIQMMGLADFDQKYNNYEIFPLKKTAALHLLNFNNSSEYLKKYLQENFLNKILFPGLGKRTSRSFFLNELEKTINANE